MIRLLIADDERMEREALADIVMRRFEHEVTVEMAENGRKAADTAVLWEADLILMDIEMPGMNGLDAARAVLEQRPECKVIFITAYSLFQYAHEAVHLGATGGERRAEYAQAGHLRHRAGRGRKSPLPRSGAAHVR